MAEKKKPIIVEVSAGLSGKSLFGKQTTTPVATKGTETFDCLECGVVVEVDGAAYPESGYCDMCRYAGDRDL
jgi:hypothetical protein